MNVKRDVAKVAVATAALLVGVVPQTKASVIEYVTNGSFEQLSGPGQPTG